jgi:hypothetical protein
MTAWIFLLRVLIGLLCLAVIAIIVACAREIMLIKREPK